MGLQKGLIVPASLHIQLSNMPQDPFFKKISSKATVYPHNPNSCWCLRFESGLGPSGGRVFKRQHGEPLISGAMLRVPLRGCTFKVPSGVLNAADIPRFTSRLGAHAVFHTGTYLHLRCKLYGMCVSVCVCVWGLVS